MLSGTHSLIDPLSDLMRADSNNADAVYVKAMCYYYQDVQDKAKLFFQRALKMDPDHSKSREAMKVSVTSKLVCLCEPCELCINEDLSASRKPNFYSPKKSREMLRFTLVSFSKPITSTQRPCRLIHSMCTLMQSSILIGR